MRLTGNLPVELPQKIKNQIRDIHLDNTSGSVKLSIKATETLVSLLESIDVSSSSQLINYVEMAAKALVNAQPAMASIFSLVNKVLTDICGLTDEEEIRQIICISCQNFIKGLNAAGQVISKLTVDLIPDNSIILTHSYSETVLRTLILAKKTGKDFDVICTESRPMKEGVDLARQLGQEGIKVTLIVDSLAFSFLPMVKLVLVGADSLSSYGLVNKIGTLGLALAAKNFKVNFYTLCGLGKILPAKYMVNLKERRDSKEILCKAIDNVTPVNYYFDLTPLEYLTGVITESGMMTSNDVEQYVKNFKIHRVFSDQLL